MTTNHEAYINCRLWLLAIYDCNSELPSYWPCYLSQRCLDFVSSQL